MRSEERLTDRADFVLCKELHAFCGRAVHQAESLRTICNLRG